VLARAGLPAPVAQFVIRDGGRFVARVDFAWPEHRLGLEYDGAWRGGTAQFRADRVRPNAVTSAGWSTVFATAADVRRPRDLIGRLRRLLAAPRSAWTWSPGADDDHDPHLDGRGPQTAGRRRGTSRTPKTSRSATRAALSPQAPCTAGPGGVAADARYTPGTGVL
jgi:hypothetical protein